VGSKSIKIVVCRDGQVLAEILGTGGFDQNAVAKELFERRSPRPGCRGGRYPT